MNKPKRQAIDTGTKELAGHHVLTPEISDVNSGYAFRVRVKDQTELDSMLMHEHISADQYFVLDMFANDLYKAGLVGIKAQSYEQRSRKTGDSDLATAEALKKLIVSQAIKHLDAKVGRPIRNMLVKLCLDEVEYREEWKRSLDLGINALENYYG